MRNYENEYWEAQSHINELETENNELKAELFSERERLLIEMCNAGTISQVQFDTLLKN